MVVKVLTLDPGGPSSLKIVSGGVPVARGARFSARQRKVFGGV
jgi:hypothetical protein